MVLKDKIALGMSLPHRSPDPIDMRVVRHVAERAEALGFRDLWVTENTLDHVFCFDPVVVLTYAAAFTSRIGLGASVVVLPIHHPAMVAHQWANLDYVSNGRAILGVGLGREHHYAQFQVPTEKRVRRFREDVALIRALWSERKTTYAGEIYRLDAVTMAPKPVQRPNLPIWMGVGHPDAVRRTARIADGWMGSGGSSIAAFAQSVPILREALEKAGRDPASFPISKRIFMAVDERPEVARAELHRWFTTVYHNPEGTDASGIHGTPEQVRDRLEEVAAMGANHLLLNPVSRHAEQLEASGRNRGVRMTAATTDTVKQQVAAHWSRRAAHFDQDFGHSIGSPEERAAWDRIFDLVLPREKALDVLDVGCGTGFLSLELAARGHRATGIDFAPAMLAIARQKAAERSLPVRFEEGDAEALPFGPGAFDLVVTRHVLWTLPHPKAAIDEWLRVLRPGARLVVVDGQSDPAAAPEPADSARRSAEYASINDRLPFLQGCSREDLEALLRAHGLVAVGGDPLHDLVAAQEQRMVVEGLELRRRRRHVVWGDRPA